MYTYTQALISLLPLLASLSQGVDALPLSKSIVHFKREVPQEHSHEQFLTTVRASLATNNPDNIQDPVFGLLGNAAAAAGQGSITDTDCLQQATADQAFTNAKAAGDVNGQVAALIYRALERNTGSVGLASVACNQTAVNPEIAAISQHQDPASTGAAATNKAITLALAQQIASVGGDPQDALKAGTFAAGTIGDPTAAGNTCDDQNDATGCIFTQNLIQNDATADEITAAVSDISAVANSTTSATAVSAAAASTSSAAGGCAAVSAVSASASVAATSTDTAAAAAATTSASIDTAAAAGVDVGPCTDFSMTFAAGLDGRAATEFSFEPTDQTNFNHGTALNPAIITQFMCDTFVNACAKSATTRDTCNTVASSLNDQLTAGTITKDQSFADAWLSGLETAFGITSTGTGTQGSTAGDVSVSASASAASTTAAATASNSATAAAATDSVSSTATDATDAASATSTTAAAASASATSSAAATSGANLQTFTGALNGVSATPIENIGGDRPFQVKTDTFVNAAAAFQRSCDQQFNGCANAANSGSGTSTVSDCQTQQTQCNAAATTATA